MRLSDLREGDEFTIDVENNKKKYTFNSKTYRTVSTHYYYSDELLSHHKTNTNEKVALWVEPLPEPIKEYTARPLVMLGRNIDLRFMLNDNDRTQAFKLLESKGIEYKIHGGYIDLFNINPMDIQTMVTLINGF